MGERRSLPPKLFLTGRPGVGKTTVVLRVLERLSGWVCRGFTTAELREGGRRVGFAATTLAGECIILAHVDLPRRWAVSRYGVDVPAFEARIVPALESGLEEADLLVVDEVGKMECFSARFRQAVEMALAAPVPVLGTVALRGGGLMAQVRCHPAVDLVEVTAGNRESLPARLVERLNAWRC